MLLSTLMGTASCSRLAHADDFLGSRRARRRLLLLRDYDDNNGMPPGGLPAFSGVARVPQCCPITKVNTCSNLAGAQLRAFQDALHFALLTVILHDIPIERRLITQIQQALFAIPLAHLRLR